MSISDSTPSPPPAPHDWPDAPLSLRLFGPFDARVDGRPLPRMRTRKEGWLLALLALRAGRSVERGWLAGTLWPDSTDGQALGNLRRSLNDLRNALGSQSWRLTAPAPGTVSLEITDAFLDVAEFDRAVRDGGPDALARAVSLCHGPLLEGCYEEWAVPEREERGQACLLALERLAAHHIAEAGHAQAAALLRRVVALDPLRESALRALMTALAAQGDVVAAGQAFRDARRTLRRELNTDPAAETTDLFHRIQREGRQKERVEAPAPPVPAAPRLPLPLTSLVGREAEIDTIVAGLDGARLLTLTGPGGIGKTRLALAVAGRLAEEFTEGPRFVDLSPLASSDLVPQAVAGVVDVREEEGRTLTETLVSTLRDRRLLLILDNCEHLVDACARLAETLLQSCPALSLLATSREAMNIPGEHVHPVPSLSLPPDDDGLIDDATGYGAIRLFAERAAAQGGRWLLNAGNAAAVSRICRRLDGVPLAIELAAARTPVLPPEQIAARLDDRFRLLTAGSRTALARHQTLKAAIDWGHDLLTAEEQALLRRLSVFSGGWTLGDAEAVCADSDEAGSVAGDVATDNDRSNRVPAPEVRLERSQILDLLSSLTAKSFVVSGPASSGRGNFRLLETIREYALGHLAVSGETHAVRRRCRDYLVLKTGTRTSSGTGTTADLHNGFNPDDVRAVLGWCRDDHDGGEAGLWLASRMRWDWVNEGRLSEAGYWYRVVLSHPGAQGATLARAAALLAASGFPVPGTDAAERVAWIGQSLAISRSLGDTEGMAHATYALAARAAEEKDYREALTLYEEALPLFRRTGLRDWEAITVHNMGWIHLERDEREDAERLLEESRCLAVAIYHTPLLTVVLDNLATLAMRRGDRAAAWRRRTEALRLCKDNNNRTLAVLILEILSGMATENDTERAARLGGAVEALRERLEMRDTADRMREPEKTALRLALGAEAFSAAWSEGRAMTWEEAVAFGQELPASYTSS